jgi:hypothetical protein
MFKGGEALTQLGPLERPALIAGRPEVYDSIILNIYATII